MTASDMHMWKTSFSEWPDALSGLCLPFQQIDVSQNDRDALIGMTSRNVPAHPSREAWVLSQDFINDLDIILKSYPDGTHIRLDLCSLKLGNISPKIMSSKDFISVIGRKSVRVSSTLMACAEAKREVSLFIFPWHPIPPWSEFRLFIRDRKIIGISQYHHHDAYPEVQKNLEAIKASLNPFSHKLIEALHMDTVVADVFVEKQADDSFKTTLIELNPFIQRTDPCLYSWQNGGDFDGGIRYLKPRYNPYRNTTTTGKGVEPLGLFREEDYRR